MHLSSPFFCLLFMLGFCAVVGAVPSPRLHKRFDEGWRFHRGDAPNAWHSAFDDSSWRTVELPHDWSIEDLPPGSAGSPARSGPFDPTSIGGRDTGHTVGGVGWYRKTFALSESWRGKRLTVEFEGVYMNAAVWFNGRLLGRHPYGYTSFHFDLTSGARFGAEPNVLAVKVDSSGRTSRWYCGSGIYRHVWLTATEPVHVAHWGVFVITREADEQKAVVEVRTTLRNEEQKEQRVALTSEILTAEGTKAASAVATPTVSPGGSTLCRQQLVVSRPALWSPESPTLHRLVSVASLDGKTVDRVETPFGIRTVEFSAQRGVLLNGKPIKLRGGCVHHDNGCLGACAYDRAEERRVALLKAAGFNALRTAHNPPSPAFLAACDRIGMLVMDEAFDCWRKGKKPQDYARFFADWWRRDLESMVLRDRNHPSVILWSIGNEVPDQGTEAGVEIAHLLADHVRSLDKTRPVTVAAHPWLPKVWKPLDPFFAQVDVCGYNYRPDRYAPDHKRLPERIMVGTESFPHNCFAQWQATKQGPWVLGDFVWTAFDYLGEAALGHARYEGDPEPRGGWPWTTANCGDLDLCGFRRPQSYYRGVVWGVGDPVACFVHAPRPPGKKETLSAWGWPDERPSWTWPGHDGEPLTVRVFSRCPKVRLMLNGEDLGVNDTNAATRFVATWQVPYQPGTLIAAGLDGDGKEVARWTLGTAGPPASLRLTADRSTLQAGKQDLSFVTVELLDARGILNPNADNLVRFQLHGPAALIGVGNANPQSVESFQQPRRRAFRGRCLAVVKAGAEPGAVELTAAAEGLPPQTITLTVK